MLRHVEVHDLPASVPDHEQNVQQAERGRADDEEVHRRDDLAVVADEREPGLPRFGTSMKSAQVARHRALGDVEAEHLQLAVDPRGAPAVLGRHPADEVPDLGIDARSSASPAPPREPVPIQLEPGAMPPDDGVRLHEHQHVRPARPKPAQHDPESAVGGTDARRPPSRLERRELLPERQVLQCQVAAKPEGRDEGDERDPNDAEHGRWKLPGPEQKINDHEADGVVSTDSLVLDIPALAAVLPRRTARSQPRGSQRALTTYGASRTQRTPSR